MVEAWDMLWEARRPIPHGGFTLFISYELRNVKVLLPVIVTTGKSR